jgi:hypothetical protein
MVYNLRDSHTDGDETNGFDARGHRQSRVHRDAQRAMLFAAGKLRSIGWCGCLRRVLRQPLAMDVDGLDRAHQSDEEQTRERQ